MHTTIRYEATTVPLWTMSDILLLQVSTSVGASDDAVACAVMLEAASALSRHPRRGQAPVVLLFNGAEELHQMAAHGFITRHRWAPSIRS
jgi:Zn-dependent M28 family amino/carboxypeptidase